MKAAVAIFIALLALPGSPSAQVPEGGFRVCVNHITGSMRVRSQCLASESEMSTRVMQDHARKKQPLSRPEIIFENRDVSVRQIRSTGNGYWNIEFTTPDNRSKVRSIELNSSTTRGSASGYEYFVRW